MRIFAGAARGRSIRAPKGRGTRPTAGRVRKALFDRLSEELHGASVLDLFAGSGALGLEALSRGAQDAVFVESAQPAAAALRENLAALGFGERARLLRMPVERAVKRLARRSFDLILLDPPFGTGQLEPTLSALAEHELLEPDGTVVAVHGARETPPVGARGLELIDTRRYGDSALTTYALCTERGS